MSTKTLVGLSAAAILSILVGNAYAEQMYVNKLNGGTTIPAGTYGEIIVGNQGIYATAYTQRTQITTGTINAIFDDSTKIVNHTISGWFNVGDLPAEGSIKDIFIAASVANLGNAGGHDGYKVSVDATGKLLFGKIRDNLTWQNQDADDYVTSTTAVSANTWFYLTISAVSEVDGTNKYAVPTFFVNGTCVNDTETTKTKCRANLNGNGGGCKSLHICGGISAAGIYVDDEALTEATVAKATSDDCVVIVTENPKVAQIGEVSYDTLTAAIEAAGAMTGDVTITLLMNPTETTIDLPENVTLDLTGNVSYSGAVTGSGKVKYASLSSVNSTLKTSLTDSAWTGTLLIEGDSSIGSAVADTNTTLNTFGNSGSKIEFKDCNPSSGNGNYIGLSSAGDQYVIQPEIVITGTLKLNNGYTHDSGRTGNYTIIRKLSGTGTIDAQGVSQLFYINDSSTFTGSITTVNKKFVLGTRNADTDANIAAGTITVRDNVQLKKDNQYTGTIVVESGSTLSMNAYGLSSTVVSNGGTIKSERANKWADTDSMKSLTINADTSFIGGWRFGLTRADGSETSLTLNNNATLNVAIGTIDNCINFRHTTVTGAGTIAIADNSFMLVYGGSGESMIANDAKLTMTSTAKLEINTTGTLTVKDFEAASGATIAVGNAAQGTLKVLGTYKNTNSIQKLELADGATIDVAAIPENGVVASATQALTLGEGVKLAINGVETTDYTLALGEDNKSVVATAKSTGPTTIDGITAENVMDVVPETIQTADATKLATWIKETSGITSIDGLSSINVNCFLMGVANSSTDPELKIKAEDLATILASESLEAAAAALQSKYPNAVVTVEEVTTTICGEGATNTHLYQLKLSLPTAAE